MGVKVFVMGLPGSGKSTAIGCISMVARDEQCLVQCFNDYDILREWFEAAPDGPNFRKIDGDGFDIHNYEVFDTSLQMLEQQILNTPLDADAIVTIEFARSDYLNALSQFSAPFLREAYFLFIDAEIATCKERIQQRTRNQRSSNDHPVSDYIFKEYYLNGREYCTAADMNVLHDKNGIPYIIDQQRIKVVKNTGGNLLQDFYAEIGRLTHLLMKQEPIEGGENIPASTYELIASR